jgi:hypothetical protein
MPVIPATQEAEVRGLWSEASSDKVSRRLYLKEKKGRRESEEGEGRRLTKSGSHL